MSATAACEGPVDRGVRRHPLAVKVLHTDECAILMSKGHHDSAAFLDACAGWNGGDLVGWGAVKHGWFRNVPDSTGEFQWLMHPATPHARGAYPATTVCNDPSQ